MLPLLSFRDTCEGLFSMIFFSFFAAFWSQSLPTVHAPAHKPAKQSMSAPTFSVYHVTGRL